MCIVYVFIYAIFAIMIHCILWFWTHFADILCAAIRSYFNIHILEGFFCVFY